MDNKRVQTYLNKDLQKWIKEQAKEKDITVSTFIRNILLKAKGE